MHAIVALAGLLCVYTYFTRRKMQFLE
ncbi:MAG: hypothetical protein H7X86_01530 [Gorillibacterium sp.]|nr:hypothetical protein [Gorillibacterium sp.]